MNKVSFNYIKSILAVSIIFFFFISCSLPNMLSDKNSKNMAENSITEVSNLQVTPGDASVTLNWDEPVNSSFSKVEITYNNSTIEVLKGEKTRTITDLTNDTNYTITVKAVYGSQYKTSGIQKSIVPSPNFTTVPRLKLSFATSTSTNYSTNVLSPSTRDINNICPFYNQVIGSKALITFQVGNCRFNGLLKDLVISDIVISGENANQFTLDKTGLKTTLKEGETSTFKAYYVPTELGLKKAKLSIISNGMIQNFTITINGNSAMCVTVDGNKALTRECGNKNDLVIQNGCQFILYNDFTNSNLRKIIVAKSADQGITWNYSIIDSDICILDYTLKLYNNTLYVAYFTASDYKLKLAKSTDNGITWTKTEIMSDCSSYGDFNINERGLHFIARDYTNKYALTYYFSRDNGLNWVKSVIETNSATTIKRGLYLSKEYSYIPFLVKENDKYKVKCAIQSNNSYTISKSTVFEPTDTSEIISYMMTVNNGVIYFYVENRRNRYLITSTDKGITWSSKTIVMTDTDCTFGDKVLTYYNNNLYLIYYSHKFLENKKIKIARSIDKGNSWKISTIVSGPENGQFFDMKISGNFMYISYEDFHNHDIKFTKSTNLGETWENSIPDNFFQDYWDQF